MSTPNQPNAVSVHPQFALRPGTKVQIEGGEFFVDRRFGERWHFMAPETGEMRFETDLGLANLLMEGRFFVDADKGSRIFAPPPPSPIAVGPEAHERNVRKHSYVMACIQDGGGLRSRNRLKPIIAEVAEDRAEAAPGFSTVLSWLDEYERFGAAYGTAAYSDRHDLKGRRGGRLPSFQERAIEEGIEAYLRLGTKRLGYDIACRNVAKFDAEHGGEVDKAELGPDAVDRKGRLRPPSRRTFERRAAGVDRLQSDWHLKGPRYAKQKNSTWSTLKLPERPYQEVEVDHCTLDLQVIDSSGVIFGRPDLIVFRDRATSMILGYGLGFDLPSYACFLEGLRHTMYPKDLSRFPRIKSGWPCFGRIENLFVDNAFHFIGSNIESASHELGFNVVQLKPRQPWLKGKLERFFGTLNAGLVHALPGTTLQNVVVRKDHEYLGPPLLTLDEFEALLTFWICEIYHQEVTKGLGVIRGVGGVPQSEWNLKAKTFRTAPLPRVEVFDSLAGDIDFRTIQRDGLAWDYIKYQSPELNSLLAHPKHRRSGEGGATRYKVVRNPYDLSKIYVIDPYQSVPFTVPATDAYATYAKGLSLHQHRVILANAKAGLTGAPEVSDLQEARSELADLVRKICAKPSRKKVQRQVARYLEGERFAWQASQLTSANVDPDRGGLINWKELSASDQQAQKELGERYVIDDDPADLDDLDTWEKEKGWKSHVQF